ncbi:Uncharacterised protein [Bordetella ansorpii]|uniref:Lipoprotein n=1 Tax=Bordetella ansorpii TaxID=288768 RepID=A0A157RLM3_9BORD|nr:DUF6683 family protein [Bordetella ansorpii]SAI58855.1 Uncharacterised protein [Bordetella ansorpii]
MQTLGALYAAVRRTLLAASGALLLASSPAPAQYINPMAVSGITLPVVMNPCPGGKCTGISQDRNRSRTGNASPPARTQAHSATLTFTPSAARRKQNLARFVASSNGDPAVKELAAQAPRIFPQLATAMRQRNLNPDSVADTYAMWWISAWDAAHGNTGTRSASVYTAVKQQAAEAMLNTPKLTGASAALKQEMAEALTVHTLLIDIAMEHAKNDPAQLKAVGQAAATGARRMGVDLSAMTLTAQGFQGAGAR